MPGPTFQPTVLNELLLGSVDDGVGEGQQAPDGLSLAVRNLRAKMGLRRTAKRLYLVAPQLEYMRSAVYWLR